VGQIWRLLKKTKFLVPYVPAIPLPMLSECDSDYYKGTCMPMFTAALFTITKLWKQTAIFIALYVESM
jgi:hypothetical protein